MWVCVYVLFDCPTNTDLPTWPRVELSNMATRSQKACPILGIPSEILENKLPSNGDLISQWRLLVDSEKKPGLKPARGELIARVALKAFGVWKRASIPTINLKSIGRKIDVVVDRYRDMMKSIKKESEHFQKKRADFQIYLKQLFDVAACMCAFFESCKCPKELKVPIEERRFLLDQRGDRKMIIAGVDPKLTRRYLKKFARNLSTGPECDQTLSQPQEEEMDIPEVESNIDITKDQSYEIEGAGRAKERNNTLKMPNLAVAAERTGMSSRSVAILTNAVLEDFNIVTPSTSHHVVDRNKVVRQRKRVREENLEHSKKTVETNNSIGMYYDGKKDETLTTVRKGVAMSTVRSVEEHYTIILEPNCIYKAHVSPKSGTAKNVSGAIIEVIDNLMESIHLIGCDAKNVNVGIKGGVIALLENVVGRPLQWCICLLHMNELPLRHLVKVLDGGTTGPKSFNGVLGKQLESVQSRPIVNFDSIPSEQLSVEPSELSTDQQYLYKMYEAVSTGSIDESLSSRNPGNISHSRWVTAANRFLRLYVSTSQPSENLVKIVRFIMGCYAPTWFSIKRLESIVYGSKHFFGLIDRCRKLDDETQKIVYPVIQRNGYFAHPEWLLLSMIVDPDKNLRKLALSRILKARNSENRVDKRTFRVPEINFEAGHYGDLISWESENIGDGDEDFEKWIWITSYTEPPVLSKLSEEDLRQIVSDGRVPDDIHALPCHNQRVERAIKLVSETSQKAAKKEDREGIIQTVITSRAELPKFETKKQFKMKLKFKKRRTP